MLDHKRATYTISKGSVTVGVCVDLQHACMSNSEMGGLQETRQSVRGA